MLVRVSDHSGPSTSDSRSQRQNVVQLGKYFPPQYFGGIEAMTQSSANALAMDYNITVICHSTDSKRHEETQSGYRVIRCATQFRRFSQPISLFMGFELRRSKPHLIHFHAPNFWGALMILLFCPKTPIVVTHHHDVEGRAFLKKLVLPLYHFLLKRTSAVFVNSKKNADASIDLSRNISRVVAIPHGINEHEYVIREADRKKLHEWKKLEFGERVLVGFVGRFVWYKGLSVLLQAVVPLPNVALLLIGEGPLMAELQREAQSLGIDDRVHFVGSIPQCEKVKYLYMMDMLVLPSTHSTEAFGISQLEALICGCPVISTNLDTGVADINIDDKTGLVVPARDVDAMTYAINRLAKDSKLRKTYGAQGYERASSHFSERNYFEKLRVEVAGALGIRSEPQSAATYGAAPNKMRGPTTRP